MCRRQKAAVYPCNPPQRNTEWKIYTVYITEYTQYISRNIHNTSIYHGICTVFSRNIRSVYNEIYTVYITEYTQYISRNIHSIYHGIDTVYITEYTLYTVYHGIGTEYITDFQDCKISTYLRLLSDALWMLLYPRTFFKTQMQKTFQKSRIQCCLHLVVLVCRQD